VTAARVFSYAVAHGLPEIAWHIAECWVLPSARHQQRVGLTSLTQIGHVYGADPSLSWNEFMSLNTTRTWHAQGPMVTTPSHFAFLSLLVFIHGMLRYCKFGT
jgi:hypothetical protein